MGVKTVFCLFLVIGIVFAAEWDYKDTKAWETDNPKCAGTKQSPINIVTSEVTVNDELKAFDRSDFSKLLTQTTISNNGHALVVAISGDTYTIGGGEDKVFKDSYKLAQFHLHWGTGSGGKGSEHTINGKQYFGELHCVFYNTKYSDLGTALPKSDGLAVLGFFIEPNYPQDNCAFNRLLNFIGEGEGLVSDKDNSHAFTTAQLFSLETLLPPDLSNYYRYQGSLTTPTCDESVTWTVFESAIQISESQMEKLGTSLKTAGGDVLVNNYRPTLNLNDRKVYKRESSATSPMATMLLVAIMTSFSCYVI